MNDPRKIAANIKYYKELKYMNNDEVAMALGITPATLVKRIEDPGNFKIRELTSFADYLQIPVTWLFK